MKSYAKINLFLDVLKRNQKNYHEIESLFAFIDLYDEIKIHKREDIGVEIDVLNDTNQVIENNIIIKIYDYYLTKLANCHGYKVSLKKNIPIGAGLGGGSSNAAIFLKVMQQDFRNKDIDLKEIAYKLGADIPFFLQNNAAIVKAIGEEICQKTTFPDLPALIIYPNIAISTKTIFANLKNFSDRKAKPPKKKYDSIQEIIEYLNSRENLLEEVTCEVFPEIAKFRYYLHEKLASAKLIRMSGSGSSFFALFSSIEDRDIARSNLDNSNHFIHLALIKAQF